MPATPTRASPSSASLCDHHPPAREFGPGLRIRHKAPRSPLERLARAGASPTRSGPEGSSRNESRLGRCQPLTFAPVMPNLFDDWFQPRMVERRATFSSRFRPLPLPRPSDAKLPFLCDHIHPDNAQSCDHLRSKSGAMFVKLGPIGHRDPLVLPESHQLENAAIGYLHCVDHQEYPQNPISSSRPDLSWIEQHRASIVTTTPFRWHNPPWLQAAATSQLSPTQKTIQKIQIRSCPTSHIALDVLTIAA